MALTTHTVTLRTEYPGGDPLDGTWSTSVYASPPLVKDLDGHVVIAGKDPEPTVEGAGELVLTLEATGQPDLDPPDFLWQISFVSRDRATRLGPYVFDLTEDRTLDDIAESTGLPITPTLLSQTVDARDAALAAAAAAAAASPGNRVTDHGAVKDDATDDAAAIQALINTVRDAARAGDLNADNVVRLPGGVYEIGSTLTVPPYVKLHIDGTVILRYTGTGTALHVTPLADDPTPLYAGLLKQQWANTPTILGGGLILLGPGPGTSLGLEVGPRSDLGADRPMARYRIGNVAVYGFHGGLKLNTFNHYLGGFDNLHLEGNTHDIIVGDTGVANSNSGENMAFDHCTLAGADTGLVVNAAGWDLNFSNCSGDYLDRLVTVTQGYGRVLFTGGHVEAINQDLAAGDGVVVSTADPADDYAYIQFDGTTFLVKPQTLFKGTRLAVSGTIYTRPPAGESNTLGFNAVAAEPGVLAAELHNRHRLNRRPVTLEHNRLNDPTFALETLGVKAGDLAKWDVIQEGTIVEVVADPAVVGGKAVQLTLGNSWYCLLTALTALPLRGPDERYGTLVLKTDTAGIHAEAGAIYTRPDGTEYAAEARVDLGAESLAAGAYRMPNYLGAIGPANLLGGRAGVKPQYLISNNTGGTAVVKIGYLYFGE